MQKTASVFVTGHRGLVGSAIVRALQKQGYTNILTVGHEALDLTDQAKVDEFFAAKRPEYVFLCAAKMAGIIGNDEFPAEMIGENTKIGLNVIDAAWRNGAKKLQFSGSSCIYPRDCPQPIKEDYLLTGPLEKTNEWYGMAKIVGIKLCQAYRLQYGFDTHSIMPVNIYGPNDNFDLEYSHVVPALLRKFHTAKESDADEVVLWGTGTARREFIHSDDIAAAMIFLMQNPVKHDLINIGGAAGITIAELATAIRDVVGFQGGIVYDKSKPDGTPCKVLDGSRIYALGWKPAISLRDGLASTYAWYKENAGKVRIYKKQRAA